MAKHTCKALNAKGFTLVEMAVVLIIFGVLVSIGMMGLRYYIGNKGYDNTIAALDMNNSGLITFQATHRRYPCPANPNLAETDPDYGYEDCSLPTVSGVRDADGNGTRDRVMIGAFPFNTLLDPDRDPTTNDGSDDSGYTAHYGYDGWGNKFTYAVTQSQTAANTFNQDFGAIDIQTEVQQSLLDKEGSAHFVIVSHGENGKGAFSKNGQLVEQCTNSIVNPGEPPPPVITTIHEIENCNNTNAIFVDGLKNNTRSRHYDDHLRYATSVITSLWGYSTPTMHDNGTPTNPADDYWINRITNLNGGGVGIGTAAPRERLHVMGDLQATKINVDEICGENSNSPCMPIAVIAGNPDKPPTDPEYGGMKCPAGLIAVAIEDNKVRCQNPFAGIPAASCPSGQRAYGFSSRDGLLCR